MRDAIIALVILGWFGAAYLVARYLKRTVA